MISGKTKEEQFTAGDVVKWMEKFLRNAGYELRPASNTCRVRPDFLAGRQTADVVYEIAGIACQNFDEASDGLTELKRVKNDIGKQADYVLVFPPLSEYFMIEFLTIDRGKRYFDIKQERLMVWICNPERETTTCLVGGPQDDGLNQYFVNLGMMSFDAYIQMRLSPVILEEEEEEAIDRLS